MFRFTLLPKLYFANEQFTKKNLSKLQKKVNGYASDLRICKRRLKIEELSRENAQLFQ